MTPQAIAKYHGAVILDRYEGIWICDQNRPQAMQEKYLYRVRQALDFIRQTDPRRFQRIQKQIRYIINKDMIFLGQYFSHRKVCLIAFGWFRFRDNENWYRWHLAATLVHEATHGVFDRHRIRYNGRTRVRIEQACNREERRFLNRVEPGLAERVLGEFDPHNWEVAWNFRKRLQATLLARRQSKARKKTAKKRQSGYRYSI